MVCGFAGSTADAFTLLERLEAKLLASPGQLAKASVELAKDWRTDKYLRNLEAMLIVTDGRDLFIITGAGDVLQIEFLAADVPRLHGPRHMRSPDGERRPPAEPLVIKPGELWSCSWHYRYIGTLEAGDTLTCEGACRLAGGQERADRETITAGYSCKAAPIR